MCWIPLNYPWGYLHDVGAPGCHGYRLALRTDYIHRDKRFSGAPGALLVSKMWCLVSKEITVNCRRRNHTFYPSECRNSGGTFRAGFGCTRHRKSATKAWIHLILSNTDAYPCNYTYLCTHHCSDTVFLWTRICLVPRPARATNGSCYSDVCLGNAQFFFQKYTSIE